MAKLQIFEAMGEFTYMPDLYDQASLAATVQTTTEFTLVDSNGFSIKFEGTGLKYNGSTPKSGTIKTVTFLDASDDMVAQYTQGNFKFAGLAKSGLLTDVWQIAAFLNSGNDVITGSSLGDDIFAGNNPGNDTIKGLGGDDFIKGFAGNNTYDGGTGFDTLTYDESVFDTAHAKKGLILDVSKGTATNPWGGTDHFKNMEEYRGSYLNDKITGSSADFEQFMGLGGADTIRGGTGTDRVRYDRDFRYGGEDGIVASLAANIIVDGFGKIDKVFDIEEIVGTKYDDIFAGNAKNNKFRGLDGVDHYDGKGGQDTVSLYSNSTDHGAEVDMTLSSGQIIDDGFGNTENAFRIENIEGTSFGDTIKLGDADGYASGNDGDDTLISGEGKQFLEGEDGEDTFVFLTASGTGTRDGDHDIIGDFEQGDDVIDVSAIATMAFIGTAAFGGTGTEEIRYQVESGNTFVYGDTDGDGDADFAFELQGSYTLTSSDFILT